VKTTRMILTVGAVLAAMAMAGCSHTVEVVVHNPSKDALGVKAAAKGIGIKHLGTAGPHSTFKGKVTLKNKYLPTNLQVGVGKQSKVCRVTKNTRQVILRVSLDGGKLLRVGKDPITEERDIDLRRPVDGPEEVIE